MAKLERDIPRPDPNPVYPMGAKKPAVPPPAHVAHGPPPPAAAQQPFGPKPDALALEEIPARPFTTAGFPVDDYDERWWFEYFWFEARGVATGGLKRTRLAEIGNAVFVKKAALQGWKYTIRPEFETRPLPPERWTQWREMLEQMLYLGFQPMDRLQVAPAALNPQPVKGLAPQRLASQRGFFRYVSDDEGFKDDTGGQGGFRIAKGRVAVPADQLQVYYRSETRSIEKIKGQGGTKRQVDVDGLVKSMNMGAAWHPFSVAAINDKMWFRLGNNKDNDYFTVVSVAQDFLTCLSFPKIDESRCYNFPKEEPAKWKSGDLERFKQNLALVRLANGQSRVVVATSTTAYMCVATGAVLDTVAINAARGADKFPEQGLEEIPLDHIFGFFSVRRYHFGMQARNGFMARITHAKLAHDIKEAQDRCGASFNSLWEIFNHWKDAGPVVTAWSSVGAGKPEPPEGKLDILNVIADPIDAGTLASMKAAADKVIRV